MDDEEYVCGFAFDDEPTPMELRQVVDEVTDLLGESYSEDDSSAESIDLYDEHVMERDYEGIEFEFYSV